MSPDEGMIGVKNMLTVLRSRTFSDHLEWRHIYLELYDIFRTIYTTWGTPEVDMFASRLNAKLPK